MAKIHTRLSRAYLALAKLSCTCGRESWWEYFGLILVIERPYD